VSSIAAIAVIWFVLPRTQNSNMGILSAFAVAGLLGYSLGPMLTHYLAMPNIFNLGNSHCRHICKCIHNLSFVVNRVK
jgi:FtsH-binding integral membrane protein